MLPISTSVTRSGLGSGYETPGTDALGYRVGASHHARMSVVGQVAKVRKLVSDDNDFATNGRLIKAESLARCIARYYGPVTQELIDALPIQSSEWWVSLCKEAKVNPPSFATIEATIDRLKQDVEVRA